MECLHCLESDRVSGRDFSPWNGPSSSSHEVKQLIRSSRFRLDGKMIFCNLAQEEMKREGGYNPK